MRPRYTSRWTLCLLLLAGCQQENELEINNTAPAAEQAGTAIPCEEVNGMKPVCGFRNPEDLAVIPGGRALLVGEMAPFLSDGPSELSLLNLETQAREPIDIDWKGTGEIWGDPHCAPPQPDKLSPHGIDLITREDGRYQLLAVNHGDEQIEFFELAGSDGNWSLVWMGCAKPPGDPFINDVAGLADGGFFATHMWNKSIPFDAVIEGLTMGENTGWVWEWQRDRGFRKVANSEALMPNGIAVNADNTKIYVNAYMGNRHIRIDRASEQVDAQFPVKSPDNVVVDEDGYVWIASHLNEPIDERCPDDGVGPCLLPFEVVRVDPQTMQPTVVFGHEGVPMGYATVALPHDGRLYFGTAIGDRVTSVALPR